jgi:hypothetical protein
MHGRRIVVTAVMCGGIALTSQAAVGDAPTDKRDGIDRAKKAGIVIDPAAEEDMAAAPVGSCPNDPSQSTCPPARAVVHVDVDEDGFYVLEKPDANTPAKTAAAVAQLKAKTSKAATTATALAPPICALRGSIPYAAAGYAQADASHECYTTAITRHELYDSTHKLYNGYWTQMASGADMAATRKLYVHPTYKCVKLDVRRYWRHKYIAYTLYNDTWYSTGEQYDSDWISCG